MNRMQMTNTRMSYEEGKFDIQIKLIYLLHTANTGSENPPLGLAKIMKHQQFIMTMPRKINIKKIQAAEATWPCTKKSSMRPCAVEQLISSGSDRACRGLPPAR